MKICIVLTINSCLCYIYKEWSFFAHKQDFKHNKINIFICIAFAGSWEERHDPEWAVCGAAQVPSQGMAERAASKCIVEGKQVPVSS